LDLKSPKVWKPSRYGASVYEIGSFVQCGAFFVIPIESFDRREPLGSAGGKTSIIEISQHLLSGVDLDLTAAAARVCVFTNDVEHTNIFL
jgi:hypothetical protein